VSLRVGEQFQFQVKGYDLEGHPLPVGLIIWNATAGEIDVTGTYAAPLTAGAYQITAQYQAMKAVTEVRVTAGPSKKSKLTWSGVIPSQKWVNFYMKVLAKFASRYDLNLQLDVEITGADGITQQQKEEMGAALARARHE
jgi:hypothetical protein